MADFAYQCEKGHAASHTDLFCSTCGSRVAPVRNPGTDERPPADSGPARASQRDLVCPVGHVNTSNDLYCGECGLEIRAASTSSRPRPTQTAGDSTGKRQRKKPAPRSSTFAPRTKRKILISLLCVAVPLSAWAAVWAGSALKESRSTSPAAVASAITTSASSTSAVSSTSSTEGTRSSRQAPTTTTGVRGAPQPSGLYEVPAPTAVDCRTEDLLAAVRNNRSTSERTLISIEDSRTRVTTSPRYAYVYIRYDPNPGYQPVGMVFSCGSNGWWLVTLVDGYAGCDSPEAGVEYLRALRSVGVCG